MKNLFNDISKSEKQRILEMHYKKGYNTINESPMDMSFYPGDDYVKDAGNTLKDILSEFKSELDSNIDSIISEIPNPESLISSANNFFGGDVTKMSSYDVRNKIKESFKNSGINEGFWSDYLKMDNTMLADHDNMPLKDIPGGIVQKISEVLMRIFSVNIKSFGIIGSLLIKFTIGTNVSPILSIIVSLVAFFVVYMVSNLIRFTKERYKL